MFLTINSFNDAYITDRKTVPISGGIKKNFPHFVVFFIKESKVWESLQGTNNFFIPGRMLDVIF